MQTVTLTRMYSGFTNIADSYEIGVHESEGKAACGDYILPEGYTLGVDRMGADSVFDPAGYPCQIYARKHGPYLVSMAGTCPDTPVLEESK
ncbi:hypothetical protein [Pararhodobacter sp.]|uniref:hypothetical protein n=1 Tax=Pararhodobacter sp. TaxID=2127056 RepID=UPI002AFFD411|nr:hypothetical protein [Pararhodobacter sp.]